jgi:hypothetical protein
MKFSDTPPTKPGAYWWKSSVRSLHQLVELNSNGWFMMTFGMVSPSEIKSRCGGFWSNRLIPAEEVENAYREGEHMGWVKYSESSDGRERSKDYSESRAMRVMEGTES